MKLNWCLSSGSSPEIDNYVIFTYISFCFKIWCLFFSLRKPEAELVCEGVLRLNRMLCIIILQLWKVLKDDSCALLPLCIHLIAQRTFAPEGLWGRLRDVATLSLTFFIIIADLFICNRTAFICRSKSERAAATVLLEMVRMMRMMFSLVWLETKSPRPASKECGLCLALWWMG